MAVQDLYRVMLKKPSTGHQYLLTCRDFGFTEELNREATASFVLSFEEITKIATIYSTTVIDMFSTEFVEIWIDRLNSAGNYQKIFYGVVTDLEINPGGEGDRTFTVKATSWFGLFAKRIAGIPKREFTATDAGEIAWTLIDESQTSDSPYSDLGITEGTIEASASRDATFRFDYIKDAIEDLSNDSLGRSFDFEINTSKEFNVYYPTKGDDLPSIVFDEGKVAHWTYRKPLVLTLANKVHVLGEGQGDDITYVTRNASNTHKTTWKLLEEKLNINNVTGTASLEDKGDRYLDNAEVPVVELVIEHYDTSLNSYQWFDYNLGDTIRANFPELSLTTASKRVTKREFSIAQEKSIGYIRTYLDKGVAI